MTSFAEAMHALERAGTAQNRKVYARHGVTGDAFGVSYKHLGALQKTMTSTTSSRGGFGAPAITTPGSSARAKRRRQ